MILLVHLSLCKSITFFLLTFIYFLIFLLLVPLLLFTSILAFYVILDPIDIHTSLTLSSRAQRIFTTLVLMPLVFIISFQSALKLSIFSFGPLGSFMLLPLTNFLLFFSCLPSSVCFLTELAASSMAV
uniref:Uncharacterized protein n=1 Tax=Opuntia streptacantha TaxID=393608 RepID=A0A7C9F2J6_OPUST